MKMRAHHDDLLNMEFGFFGFKVFDRKKNRKDSNEWMSIPVAKYPAIPATKQIKDDSQIFQWTKLCKM